MPALITRFIADDTAATSIEYALIATFISLATLIGVTALANSVETNFSSQGEAVHEAWTSRRI
ncbi:Flp family type IVb pilin [Arvimicrobium flavum]|uniref:Flp family type IVb pilin n=1 Tax=Arvimicrobium flavum TaxID=3393320 RepID=UPI00237ACD6B|nr:Flp family type IVb pilin [Mesorhizobium shangrilense]